MTLSHNRFDFTLQVPPDRDLGTVHFVAIGGAGMSGVARVMLERGVAVQGSDAKPSAVLDDLASRGAVVHVGHDAAYLGQADTVVVSTAIRETNPELAGARSLGLRVLHRAQGLAATMADARVRVAVAGANGKTTTTAMLASVLMATGADPSFAVGGELVEFATNARAGAGEVYVVEADESDGSFVVYHPHVAIVTSVQPDHLDFYGTFAAVETAYRAFVATIAPGGLFIACADDPGAAALAGWARGGAEQQLRVVTYGTSPEADVRITAIHAQGLGSSATVRLDGLDRSFSLPLPGGYNVANAAAVLAAVVLGLGLDLHEACRALSGFGGVRRRFEKVGEANGVTVVDDYAHNPAKVAAVVSSGVRVARETEGRLIAIFQPHLYSRTRDFAEEFGHALAAADVLIVLDVYAAREDPIAGVSGSLVSDAARRAQAGDADRMILDQVTTADAAVAEVAALARAGDLVVTIGAGDVTELGPAILDALAWGSHA
jgi:UDP-N-acetylmuramate--alanine ligase